MVFAQETSTGNLTVFSENGATFYLFLDGIKQNDSARSNVRITNLQDLYYNVRIVFSDAGIPPITKNNLPVSDGDDMMKDVGYHIRTDKSGKAKLHFYSMLNVSPDFIPPAGTYVYRFGQPLSGVIVEPQKKSVAVTSTGLGTLNIFSQNGEKFYLFLDGIKQNDIARSNIRIEQLPYTYYNVKIDFPAFRIPGIIKNNVSVADADDILMDATYRIRQDKAGKVKLNFYSINNPQPDFIAPAGMYVYQYSKGSSGFNTAVTKKQMIDSVVSNTITNKKGVVVKTVTANPTHPGADTNKVTQIAQSKPVKINTVVATKKNATTTNETPVVKCNGWPMARSEFAAAKQTIEDATGNESKLSAAKNIASENCLLSSQVNEICGLFSSEELKVAFAKYAYRYTFDTKNYAEVINGLPSDRGKKELTKFIKGG